MKEIAGYLKLIERSIQQQQFGKQPDSLYEPIRYIMSLGGKRIRPLLVLLGYALYRKSPKEILREAIAVEVFHNFTLMHDDIMDKAPLRRNKPTVHKKWNIPTAILSGDVMLVKAYALFNELDQAAHKKVIQRFNTMASEVCEGQQWDMEFELMDNVTEQQYLTMIKLKTAVLLGFSLEMGAILAGAPSSDQLALRNIGIQLGIGFQLKDDLLDAYGDPKKVGKQVGGDILSNKKTYLLIKALEISHPAKQKELRRWISTTKFKSTEKIQSVKAIYDLAGIPSITEKKINDHFKKALKKIESIQADEKAKGILLAFCLNLMGRQH